MNIKTLILWVVVMFIEIIALPFVLAATIISMIAFGICYLANYLAKLVLMPAFMLYRIFKPWKLVDYKYLRNPDIKFFAWFSCISKGKGL